MSVPVRQGSGGQALRVAIVADYLEEGWPSMDLVADMLAAHLSQSHGGAIQAALIRPRMPRRLSRLALPPSARADIIDRLVARQWDYRRAVRALPPFDLYHVVDHTYAHLVHDLPAGRTIVTCHDVDAFRSILQPEDEWRSPTFRWMSRRILSGLRAAAHVPCDSEATRASLIALAGFPADQLSVIPNGADATGWDAADGQTDFEAARLLGPKHPTELLHVGSTISRKRIDVLLDVFAAVRRARPEARLVRVGGPFTAEQRVRVRELGLAGAITVLPFVDRATLAAVYRRAAVALLPSEREGFGLPLVEALACGTPVVASDIPALREVGADAAEYCAVGDIEAWRGAILALIAERETAPDAWQARKARGVVRASQFSWSRYASAVADVYRSVAARSGARSRSGAAT
ncbi:MAG TPA: glycosyltransferase family 1 protein [Vicinamibacterales bacterium]|nr:glycosyltransferase family 1 protein [Vicinamibacterales bacterium]